MNKKGNLSLFIAFIFLASILLFIGVFVAPIGTRLSTEFYAAGDMIINSSANRADDISDEDVRNELNDLFDTTLDATESNIKTTTNMYKYSAIIIVILVLVAMFVYSRKMVEYGGLV